MRVGRNSWGAGLTPRLRLSRRSVLAGMAGVVVLGGRPLRAQPATDVTFLFINDVHACRTRDGLSPNCQEEGKTDENLLRHIRAINRIEEAAWPADIGGMATGLRSAGEKVATPRGIALAGDMTDDGGGQTAEPEEGYQLLQFSQRYQQGDGQDEVHFPVYAGLGNHDLDQDGPKDNVDWYRRELRDYVETSHRPGLFFKPIVPADNYDVASDSYSWNWDGLHLVQLHRFGGDTNKGAASSLGWLVQDLKQHAADGRPVVLFQHYGWDTFSIERWDPAAVTFDDEGAGPPHWWSEEERATLLDTVKPYNIAGIFHGHEHDVPMIYNRGGYDLFKPTAAFMGGLGLARVTDGFMDVALGEATDAGGVRFLKAMSKPLP
jgi:cytolysin (calcineurin-like family phosphatase)